MPTEELIFRAIAHPARRNMLAMLAESPLSVKELTSRFQDVTARRFSALEGTARS